MCVHMCVCVSVVVVVYMCWERCRLDFYETKESLAELGGAKAFCLLSNFSLSSSQVTWTFPQSEFSPLIYSHMENILEQ